MAEVYTGWKWKEAESRLLKAMELNPSSSLVRSIYGFMVLLPLVRLAETREQLEVAIRLDPLDPFPSYALAYILYVEGRPERSIAQYKEFLELLPTFPNGWWDMGMVLGLEGKRKEAEEAFRKAGQIREGARHRLGALELALLGRFGEARILAEKYERLGVRSIELARIHSLLGDKEKALAWLEKAVAERDGETLFLRTDPRLRKLRGVSRFEALVHRMALN
jgi:tetratricopeptide (TPR) repeat protein